MRLARRLKWDWIDTDNEVERRAGRSIKEIFASEGEPAFRQLERETIVAAMAKVEGNISHAAKLLGVSRAALYRKLERYGL